MRSVLNILAILLFLGSAGTASAQDKPAQVATLSKLEGTVMVDKGKGYISYKNSIPLNEGDRVVTLGGSAAEIVFNDGCRTRLKANNMLAIARDPGCKAAILAVNTAPTGAAAGGSGAGTAAGPVVSSRMAIPVLLGSAILVATQAGNGGAASGNDDTPISGQ